MKKGCKMPAINEDEMKDMHHALTSRGFLPSDFEATYEDVATNRRTQPFTFKITYEVTVRRTSTSTVRRYRQGYGSPSWVTLFDSHLAAGFFGEP
jgi:hypothetical protein